MTIAHTARSGLSRRAAPMPPQERREAVIAAALPLLAEHGQDVTTRQIAEAAGIAEGTIFRVFPDKAALIDAAVAQAFDPDLAVARLTAIDPSLPLRGRLRAAVDILRERLNVVWQLMFALRRFGPPPQEAPEPEHDPIEDVMRLLFAGSADELRLPPDQAMRMLRALLFSGTHPRITRGHPLTTDEIVDLLLDGIRAHAP